MNRFAQVSLVSLVLVTLLAPYATAHPRAITVVVAGPMCYIYSNDSAPEYWLESNGVTTGGVQGGTPADHATGRGGEPTGLQREPVGETPADTKLTAQQFATICLASLP